MSDKLVEYGVRKDGSIWMSIREGRRHSQFDFGGDGADAALIVKAIDALADKTKGEP